MQKNGIDALKRMALMAKNRLRNKVTENDNKFSKNRSKFKIIYSEGVDIKSKIISNIDSKMYDKIKQMLIENEDIQNPIARLIDYKVYNSLESRNKEKYFLDIVEKYKKYKQQIEGELRQII